jgi:hypothetical protein
MAVKVVEFAAFAAFRFSPLFDPSETRFSARGIQRGCQPEEFNARRKTPRTSGDVRRRTGGVTPPKSVEI